MLNAFRHQRIKHIPNSAVTQPAVRAQRLSASTNQTHKKLKCSSRKWRVLNAFRHQRIKHSEASWNGLATSSGAQRLSASTNQTRKCPHCNEYCTNECSTPFGINESNTPRRDRLATSCGCGAQRLSASTNQTRCWNRGGFRSGTCAQRLSASTNQTPINVIGPASVAFVLNAFRHQRIKHSSHTQDSVAELDSAQRLSASTNQTLGRLAKRCSIRQVLNAFRHQRIKHPLIRAVVMASRIGCSTPFGINESNTHWTIPVDSRGNGAQRLSASTNQTPSVVCVTSALSQVLNAFRHQRIKH